MATYYVTDSIPNLYLHPVTGELESAGDPIWVVYEANTDKPGSREVAQFATRSEANAHIVKLTKE